MFDQLFDSFSQSHIAVVGDTMLDTYWWGKTDRISPEAPVPIVALKNREYRLGGAANVALNLLSLGAEVSMHTVIGDDEDGVILENMMSEKGIDTSAIIKDAGRITTNKIRVISRSQHLLRIDHEISTDLVATTEQNFILKTIAAFEERKPAVVIFEDYNKGVLTENCITTLIDYCRKNSIITTVDPKRKNFFAYKGVDIFKPNLKEVGEALNILDNNIQLSGLEYIHEQLHEKLGHNISFITLSEKGVFIQQNGDAKILPAHIRSIADVSGAGDTVIAVASLVFAATKNVQLMAEVANLAGGLVCEEVGTVAIDKTKLLNECKQLLSNY
jgi:rfaE bifunctional protein kinase chain/domain